MLTGLKCYLWPIYFYFTDQNIIQRGDHMELNLKGLEMQKMKYINRQGSQVHEKNVVIFLVIIRTLKSYSHKNIQKWMFFVCFADESKTLVTFWSK